mgnify:CR=1 FL=1
MRQLAALVILTAVAAGFASADGLAPPPKGKKFVTVTHEVLAGKDLKGYVFVQQVAQGRFGAYSFTFSKVALDEKKAMTVSVPGARGYASLLAVPEDAAKEFKTDKELFAALEGKKVMGVQSIRFLDLEAVDEKVKESKVTWTYTVTGVDDKGIKTTVSGTGYAEPKKPGEKEPQAFAEPGYLIGGIAAALAVTLGGLWLVRRRN